MITHGRNALIFVHGSDISGDLNSVTPMSEQELADVSTFGHVGHTLYPGLAKDTLTIEGLYNDTEKALFEGMVQITTSTYGAMIAFGNSLGQRAYATAEVKLKTNAIKSVVTDVNRVSVNLEASNYPFEPGRLLSSGKQTIAAASTGQGASVDNEAASGTTGGAAYLQVLSLTGPGTLTISVQQSSTDAWAGEQTTTASFAAASSTETQRVAISSQILRYSRAAWVSTASTGIIGLSLARY